MMRTSLAMRPLINNLSTYYPLAMHSQGGFMPTISAAAYEIQYSGPVDEIAAAPAFHNGDLRATIGILLADIKFLKEQLAVTQIGMSIGFTRGWQPNFERYVGKESAGA
jgi:hypothetical protein